MKLLSRLGIVTGASFYFVLALAALLFVPCMVALAFTLLGFDLDWSSWTTYLGIALITAGLMLT